MKRREFVEKLVALGLLANVPLISSCASDKNKLNILVLGGTNFVGPAIVNAALHNGHSVTLFNRGITNPGLFPDLRLIKGDRESGVEAYVPLKKEKWDVVIDVWPEKAVLVDEATRSLIGHATHYVFISSIAVYNDFQEVGLHEGSEVVDLGLSRDEWGYSEEKLAAEEWIRERFPDKHTILRPGAIKGWRDPAVDLLYWCIKLNRDASIIAPGSGVDPLQFIDVKDVGRFAIMAAENKLSGSYNCVGPMNETLLWKDFLTTTKDHFDSNTELVWADEAFLKERQVYSFSDLPLWAPLSEDRGFMQISSEKLIQTDFEFTPIQNTLDDCMKWYSTNSSATIRFGTTEHNLGLERSRELELIQALSS